MPNNVDHVKTSGLSERRVKAGQVQYRMGCTRCEAVRWLPIGFLMARHCTLGYFGFLKARKGRA